MRFSNFVIDLSTALREVCRVFNLCSISLLDGALVITSMACDTASNLLRSLVRLLRHFHREEVASVRCKCTVPPFGHKVIHGNVNLVLHGCRLNVMTHVLEKRSPSLPLGIDVQTAYATLAPVILRNNTQDWLEIKKGIPIARMVTANAIPKVTHVLPAGNPHEQSTLTEAERQELLLEKLDLTGLEAWPKEQAEKARSLLREYHNIFSLEKHDTGHTKAAKHKIVLKDPDTPPFKERFRRIPPPQIDEVCAHLKMMLDARVI